jgi:hypothetical protein
MLACTPRLTVPTFVVSRSKWKLSDHGLWDQTNTFVPCKSEEDIFTALGLDYQPPHERTVCKLNDLWGYRKRLRPATVQYAPAPAPAPRPPGSMAPPLSLPPWAALQRTAVREREEERGEGADVPRTLPW